KKLRVVAIAERKSDHLLRRDGGSKRGALRLQRFGRRFHGNLFGLRTYLERSAQLRRLGDVQRHGTDFGGLESGDCERDLIVTRRQQAEFVATVRACSRSAALAGIVAGNGNGDIGYGRARGISDDSRQGRCAGRLCHQEWHAGGEQQGQNRHESEPRTEQRLKSHTSCLLCKSLTLSELTRWRP